MDFIPITLNACNTIVRMKVEIDAIRFGVLSPENIRKMSVCEVITDELYEDNKPKYGGLRDPRFGVSSRRGTCASCKMTWSQCSGHFGHYELPHPVFHIGWIPEVLQWLRHSCKDCGHVFQKTTLKKCKQCKKTIAKYMKINSTTIRITEHNAAPRDMLATEVYEHLKRIPQDKVHLFRGKKDNCRSLGPF